MASWLGLAVAALLAAAVTPAAAQCPPLQVGEQSFPFSQCITIPGIGSDFQLHWALAPGSANISWGMSTNGSGYGARGRGRRCPLHHLRPLLQPAGLCTCHSADLPSRPPAPAQWRLASPKIPAR